MSNKVVIDDKTYNKCLKELWDVPFDLESLFPPKIKRWIEYNSKILGVPHSYIAIPTLVAISYCSQHTDIVVGNDLHKEPALLYGIVAGRSGTNKSAALQKVMELVDNLPGEHVFEAGTLEGLMKLMGENNETAIGSYDEFATFIDSLDKGGNGSRDRSRFLSLFNAKNWKKNTSTSGNSKLKKPRFNLVTFTQPFNLLKFSRSDNHDGFFQRFIMTCPSEVYIMFEEKESEQDKSDDVINMGEVFSKVHSYSLENGKPKTPVKIRVSTEGKEVYRRQHNAIVSFRQSMESESLTSIRSKSLGMLLRVAGAINRLREGAKKVEDDKYEFENVITEQDMLMAEGIVEHCVRQSMIAIGGNDKIEEKVISIKKSGIPEPENMSIEFLAKYKSHVENVLKNERISLSKITANNHYPTINRVKGAEPARKFTHGLCHLGLGELTEVKSEKNNKIISFKRYHPYDISLSKEKRDKVRMLWEKLNIKINDEENKENSTSSSLLSSQALDEVMTSRMNDQKQQGC